MTGLWSGNRESGGGCYEGRAEGGGGGGRERGTYRWMGPGVIVAVVKFSSVTTIVCLSLVSTEDLI
jgi:hypothetical protein